MIAYIFSLPNKEGTSVPSVISAAGLLTNNGSRAFAAGSELYFNENRYRATTAFVRGNLNYNLYGVGAGNSQLGLPLNQNGQGFFGEFLRRVGWEFFIRPPFLNGKLSQHG